MKLNSDGMKSDTGSGLIVEKVLIPLELAKPILSLLHGLHILFSCGCAFDEICSIGRGFLQGIDVLVLRKRLRDIANQV
jgi:hypothetical protein